ncbi:hypothetical protein PanWU01x14_344970, partial [Parasponia andersonii]
EVSHQSRKTVCKQVVLALYVFKVDRDACVGYVICESYPPNPRGFIDIGLVMVRDYGLAVCPNQDFWFIKIVYLEFVQGVHDCMDFCINGGFDLWKFSTGIGADLLFFSGVIAFLLPFTYSSPTFHASISFYDDETVRRW